jgi:hypothetical protein
MGLGRLHAGQTHVDWVARERRQEAARAGDDAAAGPEGYLLRGEAGKIGGGGFVLGNYENNSVECIRRVECERISGLLDRILEAATMLEDGEEGGLSSSSFTAAADCRGRTATSDKDDQQRFMAEPLLASTQREHASDLRRGRDAAFWRRVDGLLAKNCTRGDGMGVDGGGRQRRWLANRKLRAMIHRRQRPRPRALETAN